MTLSHRRRTLLVLSAGAGLAALLWLSGVPGTGQPAPADPAEEYAGRVRPLLQKYCLGCHSAKLHKGDLDLERFTGLDAVRKDVHAWQQVLEQLEIGEMPPKAKAQPTAGERQLLLGWVRGLLDAEARARAGDPGRVGLRRLNNAEYTYTLRDLTGVDLQPARDFPADSAAGEGFTNTGETLVMSPALIDRYLRAAKDVAAHAVLLPDGFRFSPSTGRRDWTAEALAELRRAYAPYPPDGALPLLPYVAATLRRRDALAAGQLTIAQAAAAEKLSPKYLGILWDALNDPAPSYPLDVVRARWRAARPNEAAAVVSAVAAWQASLWRVVRVGSYVEGTSNNPKASSARQVANEPRVMATVPIRVEVKPAPGQTEVVFSLVARDVAAAEAQGQVVWQRPRLEAAGRPARLLRDYATFGPAHAVDYPALFRTTARYLAAAAEAAHEPGASVEALAKKHTLDAGLLRRWMALAGVPPVRADVAEFDAARAAPAAPLTPLQEPYPVDPKRPAIKGWRGKGAELPILLSNASDRTEMIPGTARPHRVVVHPTPRETAAVAWTSPVAGPVRVAAAVRHAHPACGNGVAWWVEHRRAGRAVVLAEGALDRGGEIEVPARAVRLAKGDVLVLAVDARNGDHSCDLTEVGLTITADGPNGPSWDLAADVADTIADGNPHADRHGNEGVWGFVKGPSRPTTAASAGGAVPLGSLLARWRAAAADPRTLAEAGKLAAQVQALLAGPRPGKKDADSALYDALLAADGPLLRGLDLARLAPLAGSFGLAPERFGGPGADGASLVVPVNSVTQVRLPAGLLRDHAFVVEGRRAGGTGGVVQFTVTPAAVALPEARWDGRSPLAAAPDEPAVQRLRDGHARFRAVFPRFVCFPQVVPDDETVCLKMYHREDEPLGRLFLDAGGMRRLDRLWAELRFISRQPVAEDNYLPQFIQYTTQDTPKELTQFFVDRKPLFHQKAEAFRAEEAAAAPAQLKALADFADRAYRRPLRDDERQGLTAHYAALRQKGVSHDEAFRLVLARVLASPHFLYRVEDPPPGDRPAPVADLALATRLSYFLWASMPDDELRRLAQAGTLHELPVLHAQAGRMLRSAKVRGLATEFGMQWLQVRDILDHKEKSETLFPTFDAALRQAFFEEAARLFQDLFQSDRPVLDLVDNDDLFVNETLARHYGLSDVRGPEWRKRGGAHQVGRGGVLTLASVLTKQAGASRTSPVLRGNWVVGTLLGEKLPRPPPNVPQLPEAEDASKLSVRQLVEQHVRDDRCAHCHRRIDPFGFALEAYDPIGRRRDRDLAGRPVDTRADLPGGGTLDGVDGLRRYLLRERRDDFVRTFCRKLLGYALGRSLTLADQPLVEEMMQALRGHDYRVSAAVQVVVASPQFRYLRGKDAAAR